MRHKYHLLVQQLVVQEGTGTSFINSSSDINRELPGVGKPGLSSHYIA